MHGDDLIAEVLRNMEQGLLRIRRKTLVPSVYRIYLNPADFEPMRDVVPFIAGEIRAALDEKLAEWNGSGRKLVSTLLRKKDFAVHVRMSDAWMVEIYPDLDGQLQPGEIEVHSELGAPPKTEYGGGSLTRRILPKQAETPASSMPAGSMPASSMSATHAPAPPSELQEAPAQPKPAQDSPGPEALFEDKNEQTKGRAFAYLRYVDQQGERVFEVTKNQVVIGRGGRSYWVDLRLETLPDVSREHCRIRRDPETGRFTLEDVSQFGTTIDGKPVGQSMSAELPPHATIGLAGVIDLRWEAA